MLPDELEWVLQMLGYNWPTADEDKLRDSAALWRKFGEDVTDLHTKANTSARTVTANNAGESIDKFTKTYEKFNGGGGGDGYLRNAAEAAFLIANVMETCAYLVEFAKWAVIAQLIALAIQIVAAAAAAPFTFGLSSVAGMGATQAARLLVRRILDELKKALLEALIETMKEPAISAIEAIITDLIRQTVNVGFGAQEGYDIGATMKAGGTAGLEALKQSPQTFAEGVRDSMGKKAGDRFHHAIDSRIDGYNGPSGTPGSNSGAGADGSGDGSSGSGDSGSGSSNSNSSSSSSDSGSSGSSNSSDSSSSSDSSTSSRSSNGSGTGVNIGNGISADTGGNDIGGPNVGPGPDSGSGSDSNSGSGQNPSSSDTPYSRPTVAPSGSSLSDFDDPSPGGASSNSPGSNGSAGAPSTAGPSHSGGGSGVSGLSSPSPQSTPSSGAASSGGTSSSPGSGSIGTQIDGLAATAPTQSNAAPAPAADSSPSSSGGRSDGGSAMPTSPTAPSTGGVTPGGQHSPGASGGTSTPSAASPNANSAPARNPSAGTPGTPSATGTGPASTPSATPSTAPRSTPAATPGSASAATPGSASTATPGSASTATPGSRPASTPDGRAPGAGDGRTPGTQGTPDGRIPAQRPGSTTPGDGSRPRNTPGTTPGDRTPPRSGPGSTSPGDGSTPRSNSGNTTPGDGNTSRNNPTNTTPGDRTPPRNNPANTNPSDGSTPRNNADSNSGTRTQTPGHNPSTTTPNQNPAQSTPPRAVSPSTGTPTTTPSTSTGGGPERSSTPSSSTPHTSTPSSGSPGSSTPSSSNPNSSTQPGHATPGTPGTQNQPSTGSPATPSGPPHQPAGNTPNTPSTPQQPAAQPHKSENTPPDSQQQKQHHQDVTAVPIHTVVTTPPASASPSHADSATPQPPGSPQANPGDSQNQHPQQDSLDDIRADLDHHPGGLSQPDPADQQALADAVPHNEDGTPERFPDPFGPWTQLQNDGGNTVPGRSNNCADCSRSFLETWYGNPQVSAPRTVDLDENGNHNPFTPEDNANDNQIRWTGAAHAYAGPGGDPNTANNIAATLQQAGPGSAAIVQVDWPGGGGHAFNVVNHDGNIVWIDTQSGEVSNQPLHIDQAEHVWHIPLDADRNPIDTSQPHTQNSEHAQQGTDTSQDGGDSAQPNTTEASDGPENKQTDAPAPSGETPAHAPGENVPHSEPANTVDGPPVRDADGHSEEGALSPESRPSDPPSDRPSDRPSTGELPDAARGSDSGSTRGEGENEAGDNRRTPPGQDGASQSDNGTRTNVANTLDPDRTTTPAPGTQASSPSDRSDTPARQAPDTPATDRPSSQQPPVTGSHATSQQHNPTARSADPRGQDPSNRKPHTNERPDSERDTTTRPDDRAETTRDEAPRQGPRNPAGQDPHQHDDPTDSTGDKDSTKDPDDHPYTDPHDRGTSDTADESRRVTEDGPDSDVSRTHETPESDKSKEYGLEPDALQQRLRQERDVHRVELDRVHDRLNRWAESGELGNVVRATNGSGPNANPGGARSFTREHLSESLTGFRDLSRGEQQAVVASLARLSLSFHQEHAVGRSPERIANPYRNEGEGEPDKDTPDRGAKISKESLGVRLHRMAMNALFKKAEFKNLDPEDLKEIRRHGPDFSGKNYAVLEVQGPPPKSDVHYIVDSSVPANQNLKGVQPRHSERHLLDWLKRMDPDGSTYTPIGLYTEREPCGQGQGHAKCSDALRDKRLQGIPIHYSTTYRDDPVGVDTRGDMADDKKDALKQMKGMSDQESRQHAEKVWREHYKDDQEGLEKALKKLEDKTGDKLMKAIKNEFDSQRKGTTTHKEDAISAEFDRHISALQGTWGKLRDDILS